MPKTKLANEYAFTKRAFAEATRKRKQIQGNHNREKDIATKGRLRVALTAAEGAEASCNSAMQDKRREVQSRIKFLNSQLPKEREVLARITDELIQVKAHGGNANSIVRRLNEKAGQITKMENELRDLEGVL